MHIEYCLEVDNIVVSLQSVFCLAWTCEIYSCARCHTKHSKYRVEVLADTETDHTEINDTL